MVKTFYLSNGIPVAMEFMSQFRSVSLGVWVKAGSVNENSKNNGVAHVIEHMLFKGTGRRTARELADAMTEIGGNMDAYTTKEYTCFYAKTLQEHLYKAIDLLGDMLTNSLFDEKDLKKELGVIGEEIDMYDDSPEDIVHERLQKAVWRDHPLGYLISGEKSVVMNFKRQDIMDFMERYYRPERMVISLSGYFQEEKVMEALEAAFGGMASAVAASGSADSDGAAFGGMASAVAASGSADSDGAAFGGMALGEAVSGGVVSREAVPDGIMSNGQRRNGGTPALYHPSLYTQHKDIEQVHMMMAFDSINYYDPDRYLFSVVNNLLGGNVNSRLFQTIREDMGLSYAIYSYGGSYEQGGLFHIYAAVHPGQIRQVAGAVLDIIDDLKNHPVTERELYIVKESVKTDLIISSESTYHRMSNYGKYYIHGEEIEPLEKVAAAIESVTAQDVQRFMRERFDTAGLSMSLVGDLRQFSQSEAESFWNGCRDRK